MWERLDAFSLKSDSQGRQGCLEERAQIVSTQLHARGSSRWFKSQNISHKGPGFGVFEKSEHMAIRSPHFSWLIIQLISLTSYLAGHSGYLNLQWLTSDLGPTYFFFFFFSYVLLKSHLKIIILLTSDTTNWHRMAFPDGAPPPQFYSLLPPVQWA